MVRLSVLGLAAYAAVCMAASASAEDIYPPPPGITLDALDIDLRCDAVGGGTQWISHIARDYRIDLRHSSVNGEALQIDEAKVVINVLGAGRPIGSGGALCSEPPDQWHRRVL